MFEFDPYTEASQGLVEETDYRLKQLFVAIAPLVNAPNLKDFYTNIVWLSERKVSAVWAISLSPLSDFKQNAWRAGAENVASSLLLVELSSLLDPSENQQLTISIFGNPQQIPQIQYSLLAVAAQSSWLSAELAANAATHIKSIQIFDQMTIELDQSL